MNGDGGGKATLTVVGSRGALLAALRRAVCVALKNGAEYAQYGDLFHQGMVMGYYDILINIQDAAARFGVSLEEIGLAGLDLEKTLIEPAKSASAQIPGKEP